MKASLRPGVSRTSVLIVDRDRSIDFMDEESRVYATPFLVRDIERTCRELLLQHGDAGADSVGTDISIRHLAPTLLGHCDGSRRAQGLVRRIGQGRGRADLQRRARPLRGRRGQDDRASEGESRQTDRQDEIDAMPGKSAGLTSAHGERTVSTYCCPCVAGQAPVEIALSLPRRFCAYSGLPGARPSIASKAAS